MLSMAVAHVAQIPDDTLGIVALVAAGVMSGLLGSWLTARQAKKLLPVQTEEMKASAAKAAVDTVDTALAVAREHIVELTAQVAALSQRIGRLQSELEHATAERVRVFNELNLTLVERAQLQEELMQMRASKVVGPPADAIIITDLETGVISFATEGVYKLLGYTPSDLLGQSIAMLVPEALREVHAHNRAEYAAHPKAREMGNPSRSHLQARTALGAVLPVEISLHPTGDGRVLALVKRRERRKQQRTV